MWDLKLILNDNNLLPMRFDVQFYTYTSYLNHFPMWDFKLIWNDNKLLSMRFDV